MIFNLMLSLTIAYIPLALIAISPYLIFRASIPALCFTVLYSILHGMFTKRPSSPIISRGTEIWLYLLAIPSCFFWALGVTLINEGTHYLLLESFLRALCLVGLPAYLLSRYSSVDLLTLLSRTPYSEIAIEIYSRIEKALFNSFDALMEAVEISSTFKSKPHQNDGRTMIVSELLVANLLEQIVIDDFYISTLGNGTNLVALPPPIELRFMDLVYVCMAVTCLLIL